MNSDMQNLALMLEAELRAMCVPQKQLYQTGNMKASINTIQVDENFIDVVIATPYASYTNTRGRNMGWIERTVSRVCRAYSSNNNVDDLSLFGQITYGG